VWVRMSAAGFCIIISIDNRKISPLYPYYTRPIIHVITLKFGGALILLSNNEPPRRSKKSELIDKVYT
jgi:hypothetical protein